VTIAIVIIIAAACGLMLFKGARRRAERAADEALVLKNRAARKSRVPEVSSNVKGVTTSQTIEPVRPDRAA
jgi:hypothetical protein